MIVGHPTKGLVWRTRDDIIHYAYLESERRWIEAEILTSKWLRGPGPMSFKAMTDAIKIWIGDGNPPFNPEEL